MERLNYIIFLLACLLISCDDFIELSPQSSIGEQAFFKTQEDLEVALNGVYASLRFNGNFNSQWVYGELPSDNTDVTDPGGFNPDNAFDDLSTMAPSNGRIEAAWRDHYRTIFRSNLIMDRMIDVDLTVQQQDQIRGEALFLRALMYFNLVRMFGDVPLITHPSSIEDSFEKGRDPVEVVYEQVINDLTTSAMLLPSSYPNNNDKGRATSGAANSLLGKVYLTLKQYDAAESALRKVTGYDLVDDYAKLFTPSNAVSNRESIFEVAFISGNLGLGSRFTRAFLPNDFLDRGFIFSGDGKNRPTSSLLNAYEDGDLRFDASIATSYINNQKDTVTDTSFPIKYIAPSTVPGDGDDNWIVLRYADVLLMLAEAINENSGPTSEAVSLVNQVRTRAQLSDLPASAIASKEAFEDAIAQERRVELAFEGHRWFDLIRTGKAIEALAETGVIIQDYQLLFPIPQGEIDVNPGVMTQNPGY